jgi:hypothetical protein
VREGEEREVDRGWEREGEREGVREERWRERSYVFPRSEK